MDSHQNGSANCLPPNAQVGEYRLISVIGEGGFGIVYRAQDLSLDRVVAIKEYLPATMASRGSASGVHVRSQHRGAFDAGLRSFINEARLLAKFSHPALVQVYRFLESNGTAYMVMCCYEGQTLRAFLEGQPKDLDERWLKATMCPLLDVLEMLHAADCYHRDIAPDNVFLQRSGMPVLLDFGAARRIIGDMTQALTMVLKPGFAPIEQYAEDGTMPQGAWTDIYQLGALLYQVITGKTPTTAVARMINDPIKPLTSAQYPAYSDEFLAGVHRALAVKPQDRPQSIAELKLLLGISDFSSGSISRLTGGVPNVDLPLDVQAHAGAEAIGSHLFPITVPTAVSRVSGAAPRAQGHDELLSLLQREPTPSAKPGPSQDTAKTRPASTEGTSVARKGASGNPTKHHAAHHQKVGRKTHPSRHSFMLWAAAPLAAVLLGSVLLWNTASESPPDSSAEDAHWATVLANPSPSLLQDYLATYPQGKHRADAEQRLQTTLAELDQARAQRDQVASTPSPQEQVDANAAATTTPGVSDNGRTEQLVAGPASEQVRTEPNDEVEQATLPAEEPPPVVEGKVVLRITPWGRVHVNRKSFGMTPPRMELSLPAGEHRISVSNPAAPPVVWHVQVTAETPVVLTHHFAETPPRPSPEGPLKVR
jgi:serine/threonine protein kinase